MIAQDFRDVCDLFPPALSPQADVIPAGTLCWLVSVDRKTDVAEIVECEICHSALPLDFPSCFVARKSLCHKIPTQFFSVASSCVHFSQDLAEEYRRSLLKRRISRMQAQLGGEQ
jgi:hypothetical protein